ncbi:putative CCR4-associated factor 1, partial [Cryptosporidium felis]
MPHYGNAVTQKGVIYEVWQSNIQEAFQMISDIIDDFPYVAVDTEFPGVVVRPTNNYYEYYYQTVRFNVDLLKVIQIGLSFRNKYGQTPTRVCSTFQFNFKFDMESDIYSQESIQFLRHSGIEFDKHLNNGIDFLCFGEYMYGNPSIPAAARNGNQLHRARSGPVSDSLRPQVHPKAALQPESPDLAAEALRAPSDPEDWHRPPGRIRRPSYLLHLLQVVQAAPRLVCGRQLIQRPNLWIRGLRSLGVTLPARVCLKWSRRLLPRSEDVEYLQEEELVWFSDEGEARVLWTEVLDEEEQHGRGDVGVAGDGNPYSSGCIELLDDLGVSGRDEVVSEHFLGARVRARLELLGVLADFGRPREAPELQKRGRKHLVGVVAVQDGGDRGALAARKVQAAVVDDDLGPGRVGVPAKPDQDVDDPADADQSVADGAGRNHKRDVLHQGPQNGRELPQGHEVRGSVVREAVEQPRKQVAQSRLERVNAAQRNEGGTQQSDARGGAGKRPEHPAPPSRAIVHLHQEEQNEADRNDDPRGHAQHREVPPHPVAVPSPVPLEQEVPLRRGLLVVARALLDGEPSHVPAGEEGGSPGSVQVDDFAGDVLGLDSHVHDRLRELPGHSEPPQRHGLEQGGGGLLAHRVLGHGGVEDPGPDRHDPDSQRPQLPGQRQSQGVHGSLGGYVPLVLRGAVPRRAARDQDEDSLFEPPRVPAVHRQ